MMLILTDFYKITPFQCISLSKFHLPSSGYYSHSPASTFLLSGVERDDVSANCVSWNIACDGLSLEISCNDKDYRRV